MNDKNLTSRQIQAIETKEKIIESTIELLNYKSFENVKITDICNKSNISVGNFYHYFDGKAAVLEEGYMIINKIFLSKIENVQLSPLDQINYAFRTFSNICYEFGYPFISVLMRYELFTNTQHVNTPDESLFSYIYEALSEAFYKNILINGNIDIVQSKIFRIFKGTLYEWIVKEGSFPLYDELINMTDIILDKYINV